MAESLVTAEKIGRAYEAGGTVTHALKDASFTVHPGELIALTGPSGSGKTTLLHLIAGLDTPSEGEIAWPDLGSPQELRPMQVTIAFQSPSLLPALNVLENVALPLIIGGASESEAMRRADEMLTLMDLCEFAEKLPEELSGGQSQRVALARALVVEPALLLADEPTGQQDRAHADQLLDFLLWHATNTHTALVVATHDPLVAARFTSSWNLADGELTTGGEA
jgi:ABC-type lipoprotein export system ATPase subunit